MGKIRLLHAAVFILLLVSMNFGTVSAEENRLWWGKDNEGWFFYRDPLIQKEKVTEEKEEDKPVQASTPVSADKADNKLLTEQMKEKGAKLLSLAMFQPTSENIQSYLHWNKFMLDLSGNFAVAWQKELMRSPDLYYNIPMADATKDLYFSEQTKSEDNKIRDIAVRAGIFFFYSSDCPYCKRQVEYIREFAGTYGFQIKAVSLDGGVFPEFPDTLMDNGISERLGVEKVPALFLAFPEEKRFERLSAGLTTTAEIKQRILYYATEINSDISLSSFNN
jgi:conjugal transfer pilus assembly protein TraF